MSIKREQKEGRSDCLVLVIKLQWLRSENGHVRSLAARVRRMNSLEWPIKEFFLAFVWMLYFIIFFSLLLFISSPIFIFFCLGISTLTKLFIKLMRKKLIGKRETVEQKSESKEEGSEGDGGGMREIKYDTIDESSQTVES